MNPVKIPLNVPLSYSKISSFLKCPFKFYQAYILKKQEPVSSALLLGRAVHSAIEKILKEDVSIETVTDKYPDLMIDSSYKEMIMSALMNPVTSMENTMIERKAAFNQDWELTGWLSKDVVFRGVFDLMAEQDGRGFVVDWKTSRKPYPDDKEQMRAYAFLTFKMNPELNTVTTMLEYLRTGYRDEMSFTKDEVQDIQDYIEGIAEEINNTVEWEAKSNQFCGYCGFRSECPLYEASYDMVKSVYCSPELDSIPIEEKLKTLLTSLDNTSLYDLSNLASKIAEDTKEELISRLGDDESLELDDKHSFVRVNTVRRQLAEGAIETLVKAGISEKDILKLAKISVSVATDLLNSAGFSPEDKDDILGDIVKRREYFVYEKRPSRNRTKSS